MLVQTQRPAGEPVGHVVLLHGLEGNGEAGYIRSMAWDALNAGFIAHRFHMRTCGGTAHLCKTLYHAGLTSDLRAFLERRVEVRLPVFLIGFSLGGNVALKLAGELGETRSDSRASALSRRPSIWRPASGESDNWTIASMSAAFSSGCASGCWLPGAIHARELEVARTLYEIDDKITAPSFGFQGRRSLLRDPVRRRIFSAGSACRPC